MLESMLSPNNGIINQLITALGGEPIFFMGSTKWFVPIVVIASVWKEIGWGTIIYLAAISSIEQEMYEAAMLDGAGRWAQVKYITLPAIVPTIVLLLILSMPNLLNAGLDSVYPLTNNANLEVSTVLDVYVLQNGLQLGKYSFATAVGMVSSVISLLLLLNNAKIIGVGNVNRNLLSVNTKVFFTTLQNSLSPKNQKFSRPTNRAFQIVLPGLKSRNAICRPSIGM